jgi:hypothetical protein
MKHYDFTQKFSEAYDKAVDLYTRGRRGAESYFSPDETAWLAANGLTAQHLYDYAEDQHNASEPGYDNALAIELVRRDYFLNVQGGVAPTQVLEEAALPAKGEQIEGIEWLPRLIPKAKAKLGGELPASLMYCCGGDRKFFKAHDILPAEFLSLVWREGSDDKKIVAWVIARTQRSH